MYYNFNKDLEHAQKYERMACSILFPDFGHLEIMKGRNENWDLKGLGGSFEVKADFASKNTGNFGLEYKKPDGTLTGISKTLAEYYFIVCYDKNYSKLLNGFNRRGWWLGLLIKTDKLKGLAKTPFYRRAVGGDDDSSVLILVPVDDLVEEADKIYEITYGVLT